jgi:tetratricopeptide (TPR) repeat protein
VLYFAAFARWQIFVIFDTNFSCVNQRHAIIVSLFFVLCFTVTCSKNGVVSTSLDVAERVMYAQPDSALNILQTLYKEYTFQGQHLARFALLYAEALERNDLAFTKDSLISHAIGYYSSKRDYGRSGRLWFYLGKIYAQRDSMSQAMVAFLQAKEALEEAKETDLLGLLVKEMALLYEEQHYYKEAITLFEQSLLLFQRSGNKLEEGYVLLQMADLLSVVGTQTDSVQIYFDKAKEVALTRNDMAFMYEVSASNAIAREAYTEAKQIIFSSIKEHKQGVASVRCSSLLGSLYYHLHQIDSARYYKQRVLQDRDATAKQRVSALRALKEIEQQAGKYESALQYALRYIALSDSVLLSYHTHHLPNTVNKFYLDRLIGEKTMLRIRYTTTVIGFGILATGGIFGARYIRKKYLVRERERHAIALSQLGDRSEEKLRESLEKGWNDSHFKEKFLPNRINLTNEAGIAKITTIANLAYPGLIEWLQKKHPRLTDEETALTCLLFTGYEPKELCLFFKIPDIRAMHTRCSRLYQKLDVKTTRQDPLWFRKQLTNLYVEGNL